MGDRSPSHRVLLVVHSGDGSASGSSHRPGSSPLPGVLGGQSPATAGRCPSGLVMAMGGSLGLIVAFGVLVVLRWRER